MYSSFCMSIINYLDNAEYIFIDLDGTLIDTDFANFLAYQKALKVFGINIEYNNNARLNLELIKELFPCFSALAYKEISRLKSSFYQSFLAETKLNEELCELLKSLPTKKKVLVSKSKTKRALLILKHHNTLQVFDTIFTYGDMPDSNYNKYQLSLANLGINPNIVLAFENEQDELNMAKGCNIPHKQVIKVEV